MIKSFRHPYMIRFLALVSIWVTVCLGHPAPAAGDEALHLHQMAGEMLARGKAAEAANLERQAVELSPDDSRFREQLFIIYSTSGRYEEALKEAQQLTRLMPEDGLAHFNLATALHRVGRKDDALLEYDSAIRLGETSVDVRRGRAICLMDNGYVAEAVPELEKLSAEEPDSKDVWMNLGWAYLQYGDMDASVKAAQKALEIDPDFYFAWGLRAQQARLSHLNDLAEESAKRMIALEPQRSYAYAFLGDLSAERGMVDIGRFTVNKARESLGSNSKLFSRMGQAFQERARQEKSLQKMRRGYLNRSRAAAPWIELAGTAFKQCLATNPDNFEANLGMAELLFAGRFWHEAYPYARKAIALNPESIEAKMLHNRAVASQNDLAGWLRKWFQTVVVKKTVPEPD